MSLASLDPGNAATGLALVGGALILAVVAGLVWVCRRLSRLPARPRRRSAGYERIDLAAMGCDPVEDFIEQALRYEADQQMLRRVVRPDAAEERD